MPPTYEMLPPSKWLLTPTNFERNKRFVACLSKQENDSKEFLALKYATLQPTKHQVT